MDKHGKTTNDLKEELSRHRQKIMELIDAEQRCRISEKALRDSEEKYHNLVDNINDWLWEIDRHGVYTYVSSKVVDLLGYSPGEVLGKTQYDLMDEPEAGRVKAIFSPLADKREPFKLVQNIKIHKDGHRVFLESSGTPIVDDAGHFKGYRGSDRDITIRKQAEEALQKSREELELRVKERTIELTNTNMALKEEVADRMRAEIALKKSEAKYRDLVQNANSIILRMDVNGNVTFFNEFAQRFFGYPEDEILGKNVVGTIVPKTGPGRDLVKMILDIGRHPERYMTNENENLRRDGSRVWVAWTNKAIFDQQGNVSEILCIGNDITELKQTEEKLLGTRDELIKARDELIKARDELEMRVKERTLELTNSNRTLQAEIYERIHAENELREMKAQTELYIDLMGHDINNMNQVAMGYLDLALESLKLDKEERMLLAKPLEMLQNSSHLISNVRKLKLARSGGLPLEAIDVDSILVELQKAYGHVPGRDVQILYTPVKGCAVVANELLRDVFSNILGNSIKHSSGPLTIRMELVSKLEDEKHFCKVAIEDNGPGIPDDIKDKLFKGASTGIIKPGGHGIGLYLVRTLVENFHGKIRVEDTVPGDHTKGCRFVVLLPKASSGSFVASIEKF